MVRKLGFVLTTALAALVISVAGLSALPTRKPPGREEIAKSNAPQNRQALPAGVSESWWAHAQRHILNDQRTVKITPNGEHWIRAKGLKATLNEQGARIFPDAAGAISFPWSWVSIEGLVLEEPTVSAAGRVVTVDRGPARETFENRADGLEHVVVVEERPKGAASLRIHIPLTSAYSLAKPSAGRERIEFRDGSGQAVLEYRDLKVYDQRRRLLESTMEPEAGGILISVQDQDAAYPVTVDPVLVNDQGDDNVEDENYGWIDNASVLEEFGYAVASAGDVNGDAVPDVVVGAPGFDRPGQDDIGVAYVWLGVSTGGLQLLPAWYMEGPTGGARFGTSVAGGGDWDASGLDDILIGAPGANDGEGLVYLYLGPDGSQQAPSTSLWIVEPPTPQEGAQFGTSVAWIGDVNTDGFDDFAVGAPLFDTGNVDAGYVAIFPGAAAFNPAAPPPAEFQEWSGPDQEGARFGFSVAGAMDVDASGELNLVVGAPGFDIGGDADAGAAFVYEWDDVAVAFDVAAIWDSQDRTDIQENAQFGFSVAGPGDVNGDGADLNDILIGAPGWDVGSNVDVGAAYLFLGDAADGVDDVEAWSANGEGQAGAQFGYSVSGAGNVNGDFSATALPLFDVVIGAPGYDFTINSQFFEDAGRVYVYLTDDAIDMLETAEAMAYSGSIAGATEGARLGTSVAGAGDISGDGDPDVIFGAPGRPYEAGPFSSISDGVGTVFSQSGDLITNGPPPLQSFDDFPPMNFLMGNRRYDARFGFSIASGGDLNNDNHHDVIVGAPDAVTSLGRTGAVYVFLSIDGVGLSNEPSAIVIPPANPEGYYWGNQFFGTTVAFVGDVDQDDNDEFAVYGSVTNLVYVYSYGGSATMLLLAELTDGSENTQFGYSIAGGDVNLDGFSDVIVGAPATDLQPTGAGSLHGAVWVFTGGGAFPEGALRLTTAGLYAPQQNGARLGECVAVGNWDGEPGLDFMAGEPGLNSIAPLTPRVDVGRVVIWSGREDLMEYQPYGSSIANGLMNVGDCDALARFGTSISTGDVDGDTTNSNSVDEIIVGAPFNNSNAGTVFVYSFLSGEIGQFEGDAAGDRFGSRVAYVGNANNDELQLGDFAVTAPGYEEGEVTLGRIYLYTGGMDGSDWIALLDSQTSGLPEMANPGELVLCNGAYRMNDNDQWYEVIVGSPLHFNEGVGGGGKMGIYRGDDNDYEE